MKQTIEHEAEYESRFETCREQISQFAHEVLLRELIPPWCTGIDPAFWLDGIGRKIALLLWGVNYTDAISLKEAGLLLYGHAPSESERQWIREETTVYPYPGGVRSSRDKAHLEVYVLRSAILRLKESGQYRRARPRRAPTTQSAG